LKRSELAQQLKQLKQERSLLKIRVNELEDVERKKQQKFMNLEEIKDLALEDLANDTQLEMMLIPGGTFIMGSLPEELEHQENESPQHSVTVQPFFMGKYQVTQAQWRFVAQLPQVNRDLEQDPSRFKGDNRPVEQVSWEDAVEFCDRLSQYTGRTYRLPSEAEWEYACRAGTTTPFHFGETITTDLANYDGNSTYGNGVKGVYRKETTEVGSFGVANNFGLYDMHGNVWEWCQDNWHSNYEGAPTDGNAWLDNEESSDRKLLRGGSWDTYPVGCRSACRAYNYLDGSDGSIGFRVVCSAMCSKLK
jgi:formylglycine-generating enzyme required for sulfatase activity